MLKQLREGGTLLAPLTIRSVVLHPPGGEDAAIEVTRETDQEAFRFVVESKARSTPEAVQTAMAQAIQYAARQNARPLIQVPYLSPERLADLEAAQISGVDLCGNGIVVIPDHLYILRTGQPNRYRDSRPLVNPFQGRSALVSRKLLRNPRWGALSELAEGIRQVDQGNGISLSQVSKAITALAEELIVIKTTGGIALNDPIQLLDRLAEAWSNSRDFKRRQAFRLAGVKNWATQLSKAKELKWSLTGESSASQYITIAQGGPKHVAVSDLDAAQSSLDAEPESIMSFADILLLETDQPGYFFDNQRGNGDMTYASRIQTWLELQNGDARQRETARDLYQQIINEVQACQ